MLPKIEISPRNKKIVLNVLSFILVYGFIFALMRLAQVLVGPNEGGKVGNVCSLDTAPVYQDACDYGFEQGVKLIKLLAENGSICSDGFYPTFQQQYDACQPFYGNDTLTGDCLSGLEVGISQQLVKQGFNCTQNAKDNQTAALASLFITVVGFFAHKAANTEKFKQVSETISEKIFDTKDTVDESKSLINSK